MYKMYLYGYYTNLFAAARTATPTQRVRAETPKKDRRKTRQTDGQKGKQKAPEGECTTYIQKRSGQKLWTTWRHSSLLFGYAIHPTLFTMHDGVVGRL